MVIAQQIIQHQDRAEMNEINHIRGAQNIMDKFVFLRVRPIAILFNLIRYLLCCELLKRLHVSFYDPESRTEQSAAKF